MTTCHSLYTSNVNTKQVSQAMLFHNVIQSCVYESVSDIFFVLNKPRDVDTFTVNLV